MEHTKLTATIPFDVHSSAVLTAAAASRLYLDRCKDCRKRRFDLSGRPYDGKEFQEAIRFLADKWMERAIECRNVERALLADYTVSLDGVEV
jgi:hypothetical protein